MNQELVKRDLHAKVTNLGDAVRALKDEIRLKVTVEAQLQGLSIQDIGLKVEDSFARDDALQALILRLLEAKAEFEAATGEAYTIEGREKKGRGGRKYRKKGGQSVSWNSPENKMRENRYFKRLKDFRDFHESLREPYYRALRFPALPPRERFDLYGFCQYLGLEHEKVPLGASPKFQTERVHPSEEVPAQDVVGSNPSSAGAASSSSSPTEVEQHVLLLHEAIVEAGLNSEVPSSRGPWKEGTVRPLRRVDSRGSSMSYETAKTAKTGNVADVIVWLDRTRSHLTTRRTADAVADNLKAVPKSTIDQATDLVAELATFELRSAVEARDLHRLKTAVALEEREMVVSKELRAEARAMVSTLTSELVAEAAAEGDVSKLRNLHARAAKEKLVENTVLENANAMIAKILADHLRTAIEKGGPSEVQSALAARSDVEDDLTTQAKKLLATERLKGAMSLVGAGPMRLRFWDLDGSSADTLTELQSAVAVAEQEARVDPLLIVEAKELLSERATERLQRAMEKRDLAELRRTMSTADHRSRWIEAAPEDLIQRLCSPLFAKVRKELVSFRRWSEGRDRRRWVAMTCGAAFWVFDEVYQVQREFFFDFALLWVGWVILSFYREIIGLALHAFLLALQIAAAISYRAFFTALIWAIISWRKKFKLAVPLKVQQILRKCFPSEKLINLGLGWWEVVMDVPMLGPFKEYYESWKEKEAWRLNPHKDDVNILRVSLQWSDDPKSSEHPKLSWQHLQTLSLKDDFTPLARKVITGKRSEVVPDFGKARLSEEDKAGRGRNLLLNLSARDHKELQAIVTAIKAPCREGNLAALAGLEVNTREVVFSVLSNLPAPFDDKACRIIVMSKASLTKLAHWRAKRFQNTGEMIWDVSEDELRSMYDLASDYAEKSSAPTGKGSLHHMIWASVVQMARFGVGDQDRRFRQERVFELTLTLPSVMRSFNEDEAGE